ncbi:MAG TPA: c-type cytochrome [Pseudohongiella sp.]|nr:c-type cytochrome [Pseudohongiella sp.]
MKNLLIPGFAVVFTAVIVSIAMANLDTPNQESINSCYGECYNQYVAENGNILDQQRAAAEAAKSASPAELGRAAYAGCAACHGANGQGGMGPQLAGHDASFIIEALTAYKNRETRGAQSAVMFPTASALSAQDIENLAAFVETL